MAVPSTAQGVGVMRKAMGAGIVAVTLLTGAIETAGASTPQRGVASAASHATRVSVHTATRSSDAAEHQGRLLSPHWTTRDNGQRTVRDAGACEFLREAVHRKSVRNADGSFSSVLDIYFAGVISVPDLDGDKKPDLISLSVNENKQGAISTSMTARRGVNGNVIWTKTFSSFSFPIFGKVGPKAVNGFYLVSYGYTTDPLVGAGGVATTTVTAVDAKLKQIWTKDYYGGDAYADAADLYASYPNVESVARMNSDAADDLVVAYSDDAYSYVNEAHAAEAEVVSGADASTISRVGPVVLATDYTWPTAIDDLTGDGLADVFALELDSSSPDGWAKLSTFKGTDGSRLWSAQGEYLYGFPLAVSDMTGDKRTDLLAPLAIGGVRLLNGVSGATVWTRADDLADSLGDLDGDRKPEVLTTSYSVHGPGSRLTLHAVDGANKVRWTRVFDQNHSGARLACYYIGDIQGDGIADYIVLQDWQNKDGSGTHHQLISGRNGATIRDNLAKTVYGAYGAIDGHGDDLLQISLVKDRPTVVALRGENGKPMWTWRGAAGYDVPGAYAVELTGDRRADVVLMSGIEDGGALELSVLNGANGKPLWSD